VSIDHQPHRPVGELLREWRVRRRLTQLALSIQAEISTRHLSFVETGRAAPSREMVIHLAEQLDVPLRERNQLLLAAGFAPAYAETGLDAPRMAAVRAAVRQVLAGHEPFPALVLDRGWNIVDANASVALFTAGVPAELLAPPANVIRISLHPDGLASRIVNFAEWREHLLTGLRRQVSLTADPALADLYAETSGYPVPPAAAGHEPPAGHEPAAGRDDTQPVPPGGPAVFVPLRIRHEGRELSFFSTVTAFGTPLDITVAELAIEAFYPADEATAAALGARQPGPAKDQELAGRESGRLIVRRSAPPIPATLSTQ
jgi:transcriptional regulator with XRE-family HTH domain